MLPLLEKNFSEQAAVPLQREMADALRRNTRLDMKDLDVRLAEFAQGKTVLLVTHRTSLLQFVNRVIVVDNGRIVADGPRERIMEALQSGRIARAA